MKSKPFMILVLTLICLSVIALYAPSSSSLSAFSSEVTLDGTDPPHAVDVAGKIIPESSATQPDQPIILSKDSRDPKWGELKPEAVFDHTKHHDVTHTLDGKTATACVYCHHTEQPMPVAGQPYLKKSERTAVLTAAQLETSKQPVNSCRHCHFQEATAATAESPPKSVRYPKEMGLPPSGKLTNDVAYHLKCMGCHDVAMKRDPKLKAPQGCGDCHIKKT
ncbi:MAG: cytochrome c3 family protein [Pyrinomonadaceae bacterium]